MCCLLIRRTIRKRKERNEKNDKKATNAGGVDMNHGFATYFRGGMQASVKTIYKNKGFLLVWLYTVMSLIGKLTIVFAPVFILADIRQAKLTHAENRAHVAQNFRVACKVNTLWAYYGALLLEGLILLAGLVLIAIPTALLAGMGILLSYAVANFPMQYILIILCSPGMLAALVYLIVMPIYFAPTAYIIESNPGISAAAAVSASFKTMRRCGKWTLILSTLIPLLIIGAICGVGFGVFAIINLLFRGSTIGAVADLFFMVIAVATLLCTFPIFDLARKVAVKSLFDDICLDPVNASKHTAGVNIQKCKGVLFEPETVEENLSVLFDETQEESTPLPTSRARVKHDESARAGEEKVDLSQEEEVNYDNSDRQEQS